MFNWSSLINLKTISILVIVFLLYAVKEQYDSKNKALAQAELNASYLVKASKAYEYSLTVTNEISLAKGKSKARAENAMDLRKVLKEELKKNRRPNEKCKNIPVLL